MANTKFILEQAYSAFNRRDIDGALALMTQNVSWPKAFEGGKVVGKEARRQLSHSHRRPVPGRSAPLADTTAWRDSGCPAVRRNPHPASKE